MDKLGLVATAGVIPGSGGRDASRSVNGRAARRLQDMHRTLCGTAQCRLNDRSTRAFRRAHNEVATDLPSEACCGPVSSTRSRSMTTAARKSGSTNRSARHGPGLVVCRVWPAVARHCWSSSLRRSPRSRSCGFSSPGRATRCSRACDRPGSVHAGVGDPRQHDGPASRPVWHIARVHAQLHAHWVVRR